MNKARPGQVLGILFAAIAAQAILVALRGGVYFGVHEGDMLHLVELAQRIAQGQVAHLDFETPIGEWAIRPISLFIQWGLPIGQAMLWSQIAVACLLAPAIAWVALSRLPLWLAAAYCLGMVSLLTAVIYGGTDIYLSFSMHYNRWAWALAFLVVPLMLIPAPDTPRAAAVDGVVIGAALGALAVVKVTYAVAFFPPVLLGLLIQRRLRVIPWGLGAGLAVLLAVTLDRGIGFWPAYVADLLTVMGSEGRPYPGEPLSRVLLSPAFTIGTLLTVVLALLLRAGAATRGIGLTLLLFVPAFAYASFQNFGNDQLWLAPLALCFAALATLSAETEPGRARILTGGALIALVAIGPVLLNIAYSPIRHALEPSGNYGPIFRDHDAALFTVETRMRRSRATEPLVPAGEDSFSWAGADFTDCELDSGFTPLFRAMNAQLAEGGHVGDKQPFVADIFAPHWLYTGWAPLRGGAPWYYDGLPGIEDAETLLVPSCPTSRVIRRDILDLIDEESVTLLERTDLYALYRLAD